MNCHVVLAVSRELRDPFVGTFFSSLMAFLLSRPSPTDSVFLMLKKETDPASERISVHCLLLKRRQGVN